ncbi:hypothetical protein NQ317_015827 [Molorchus minor]|uniref:Uncharacterized protein n=1 Tax=Molorchus minor TaxID=1323400 RepID=A0ABQ9JME0_9CUCU|nr:hypothetical protein NQ317_015827 [Molorchus minor]
MAGQQSSNLLIGDQPAPAAILSTIFCSCTKCCGARCGCRKAGIRRALQYAITVRARARTATPVEVDNLEYEDTDEDGVDATYEADLESIHSI